jgi:hypothetical protein
MDWCRDATREYLKSQYNAQDEETYYQNEPFVDFIDTYESYDDKLMYREDFDTDEEYEDYLLNEMDV